MKKIILLSALVFSATLFAAETPQRGENMMRGGDNNVQQCPNQQRGMMPMMQQPTGHMMGMGWQNQRHQSHDNLFKISVKSSNPIETLKGLTSVIPEGKAKQYQVTVTITELPEPPAKPERK